MSVFSPKRYSEIEERLRALMMRPVQLMSKVAFKASEFEEMLIAPEHLAAVRLAWEICRSDRERASDATDTWTLQVNRHLINPSLPMATQQMQVHCQFPAEHRLKAFVPGYANIIPAELPPGTEATRDRLYAAIDSTIAALVDYARALAVFYHLDYICSTTRQVRYFLPGIVTLLDADVATKKLADSVREYKVPTSLPNTSEAFRLACTQTHKAMARAMMLLETDFPENSVTGKLRLYWRGNPPMRFEFTDRTLLLPDVI